MGVVGEESDAKSQLVADICSISACAVSCARRHRRHSTAKISSPFIDWYLLLRVEEDAGMNIIRKQYHKLALQLHPDKNKHPKAEFAFKLASEAYACLSDHAKRRAFNLERWKSYCTECNGSIPRATRNPSSKTNATKHNQLNITDRSRSKKILQGLKEIRERFKEEARVMESFFKANYASSRKESPLFNPSDCTKQGYPHCRKWKECNETPVFNPSDYLFQSYHHCRSQKYRTQNELWFLQTRNTLNYKHGRGKCEYPIFEMGSEAGPFRSKSVCLNS
ncbi:uncharacterized protein LOC131150753 [Malania oleifera]|uniref:uncharacterized protein LOC131150753 n=1 Tax=Malania oleifera TaxID=397392 RepID=UPI0025ADD1D5|nr:uncharacterized protein LOC131150753 [Malania oleifera]